MKRKGNPPSLPLNEWCDRKAFAAFAENLCHRVAACARPALPPLPVNEYRMQENAGVVSARNYAIRASSGEWIASCDSDDVWLPEKLRKQRKEHAEKNGGHTSD